MANELKRVTKLSWSRGGQQILLNATELLDAGLTAILNHQIIGNTSEAILFGDVTGSAMIAFKNTTQKWDDIEEAIQKQMVLEDLYTDEDDYNLKNTVYISDQDPATSVNAIHTLGPGNAASFTSPTTPEWFAISYDADHAINLLVAAYASEDEEL